VPATFGIQHCNKTSHAATRLQRPPKGCAWEGCRAIGTGGAYGRIIATPTTLTYNRIANNGGTVTDSWTITQHNHGPFRPNPTPPPTPPAPRPTPPPAPPTPPTPPPAPGPVPGTTMYKWEALTGGKTTHPSDLPPLAVASGAQARGGKSYVCHADHPQGGEADLAGSISYAGAGHCRVETAGKAYYLTSGFRVMVSKSPYPYSLPVIFTIYHQRKIR
jgi:hypothetical protein